MPVMDGATLLVLFIVACGSGLFLRLVAKEKHRRERHIQQRFLEKVKELEEAARRNQEQEEEAGYE